MDEREIGDELAQPGARELLEDGRLVRLAYTGEDGAPRVIPIGFHWTGAQIVVCTIPTSPKVRAIAERPEVALVIDTGSTPAETKSLSLRGPATLETVDGVPDEYLAGAAKSLDADALAAFEEGVRAAYSQMVRIAVTPRWARYYEFGTGRLPRTLAKALAGAT